MGGLYHLSVPPQRFPLLPNTSSRCSTFNNPRSVSSTQTPTVVEQESSDDQLSLTGCKACGKKEIENGCNGEGRIQGGIATVPGFGWWPIKAYRPCPAFVATGGRYRRTGQSMDEVVSGNSSRDTSIGKSAGAQASKKKEKKYRNSKADV